MKLTVGKVLVYVGCVLFIICALSLIVNHPVTVGLMIASAAMYLAGKKLK